jgi:hypothetical protein
VLLRRTEAEGCGRRHDQGRVGHLLEIVHGPCDLTPVLEVESELGRDVPGPGAIARLEPRAPGALVARRGRACAPRHKRAWGIASASRKGPKAMGGSGSIGSPVASAGTVLNA